MPHRPASELAESLRNTLQKLEENFASPEDQPQIAELKRILLLRIADLELFEAVAEKTKADEPEHQVHLPVFEDGPETA